MESEPHPEEQTVVTFRLGGQMYALPIESIVRIIEIVPVTPLPQVDNVVKGVINVHSTAVPVVDMRCLFDLPEAPVHLYTPIILVRLHGVMVGLIVDEVVDVLHLAAGAVFRTSDILPGELGEVPILQGVTYVQGETVLLLNPPHLLKTERLRDITGSIASCPEPGAAGVPGGSELLSEIMVDEVER
ncbi:MAG: chemotaxis protein CheW [Anaerolineae bacterium]|nr:chemotaxis protein CheW [Anaerolineae bacterium]